MTLPPEKIGDKGQRYVVKARSKTTGGWETIGYTPHADGGSLAEGVKLHPGYDKVWLIDRGEHWPDDKGGRNADQ